jgi:hypothetical protein
MWEKLIFPKKFNKITLKLSLNPLSVHVVGTFIKQPSQTLFF